MKTNIDKSLILNRIKKAFNFDTDTDLADYLGISRSTLSNWYKRNSVDYDLLFSKCELININWLLTGEGDIFKDNEAVTTSLTPSNRKTIDPFHDEQRVPLLNLEATMGLLPKSNGDFDEEYIIDYLSIPNLPSVDGAIYATGDSMYPVLKAGDIIAFKRIDPENIFFGEIYLLSIYLDESSTYKTIKYVQKSDLGNEYIKLVSHNQHHQEKDIRLSQIAAMGLVRASIRIHN